jgi:hypothetical protein
MQNSTNKVYSFEFHPALAPTFKVAPANETNETVVFKDMTYSSPINRRIISLINEFKTLRDNWDEDGGLAPNVSAIRFAENLVRQLQKTGQKVFHTAPGPNGEVMVDLRENGKSLEIIFYPTKARYVKFPSQGDPIQGDFNDEIFPTLLKWLNG